MTIALAKQRDLLKFEVLLVCHLNKHNKLFTKSEQARKNSALLRVNGISECKSRDNRSFT